MADHRAKPTEKENIISMIAVARISKKSHARDKMLTAASNWEMLKPRASNPSEDPSMTSKRH
jgi:hypothetical protein